MIKKKDPPPNATNFAVHLSPTNSIGCDNIDQARRLRDQYGGTSIITWETHDEPARVAKAPKIAQD